MPSSPVSRHHEPTTSLPRSQPRKHRKRLRPDTRRPHYHHHATTRCGGSRRNNVRVVVTLLGVVVVSLLLGWNLHAVRTLHRQEQHGDDDTRPKTTTSTTRTTVPGDDPTWFPPRRRTPTHHACVVDQTDAGGGGDEERRRYYRGVYHIQQTDEWGGVGTALIQLVVGQLLYAERYQLLPWVHLNDHSRVVYDPVVHGGTGTDGVRWRDALVGGNVTRTRLRPKHGRRDDIVPGPPAVEPDGRRRRDLRFSGTGVWEHYFAPVSDFVPGDRSCVNVPYVTVDDASLISPGLHGYHDELATRCWRYEYLPDHLTRRHRTYHEWWEPQRVRAHDVMRRRVRMRPYLRQAAVRVNPDCGDGDDDDVVWCLGLHIRRSDKAAGRRVLSVDAFLPYVRAFFRAGGDYVYVATDGASVLSRVRETWPLTRAQRRRIRSSGDDVVRSDNETAVFDVTTSHHRTNVEVLTEILALSRCQFLIHGLSAVSETAIWINLDLHNRSVNLENDRADEIMSPDDFGRMVALTTTRTGRDASSSEEMPRPARTDAWWDRLRTVEFPSIQCDDSSSTYYKGVLVISDVAAHREEPLIDQVLFVSVLHQLAIAKKLQLQPVVLLDARQIPYVYDETVHVTHNLTLSVVPGEWGSDGSPTLPSSSSMAQAPQRQVNVVATNVWNTYVPGETCATSQPWYRFDAKSVVDNFSRCPWSIRVPETLSSRDAADQPIPPWNEYLRFSRKEAHKLVSEYMKFHPVLYSKADEVNPSSEDKPCLGVLFQMTTSRKNRVSADKYLPYLRAFVEVSDGPIYIASDTIRPMRYMEKNFPAEITRRFRSQGTRVARSEKADTPLHMMDSHHRINSEMLVDAMALSKCRIMIHSSNAMAEAALYLNPHNNLTGINLEDPQAPLPADLKTMLVDSDKSSPIITEDDLFTTIHVSDAKVLSRNTERGFSRHAIVYLAQKRHSTYGRDSFGTLLRSLTLLRENYLRNHTSNVDIIIFHVASFDTHDLAVMEHALGPESVGAVRLVDLDQSAFWGRPDFLQNSDPHTWDAFPLFSEGYRHMIQFFAIHIWDFFARLNQAVTSSAVTGSVTESTGYRYVMRLDEDSFLHSPIDYDIFDWMEAQGYVYGYRMCSYEMQTAQRMWKRYQQTKGRNHVPKRDLALEGCGFYNNFFVADLEFFRRGDVREFLQFIHRRGHIYVRRLGDLMIHTMAIYKFAESSRVHRFLDFTYEHGTLDNTTGCLVWGGMQAGYRDAQASERLTQYYRERSKDGACPLNQTTLSLDDLSPTYAHLPPDVPTVALQTVVAGSVEVIGKGLLSG